MIKRCMKTRLENSCIWDAKSIAQVGEEVARSVSVCCRERELCGFEHDRFVIESDSVQLTYRIEAQRQVQF